MAVPSDLKRKSSTFRIHSPFPSTPLSSSQRSRSKPLSPISTRSRFAFILPSRSTPTSVSPAAESSRELSAEVLTDLPVALQMAAGDTATTLMQDEDEGDNAQSSSQALPPTMSVLEELPTPVNSAPIINPSTDLNALPTIPPSPPSPRSFTRANSSSSQTPNEEYPADLFYVPRAKTSISYYDVCGLVASKKAKSTPPRIVATHITEEALQVERGWGFYRVANLPGVIPSRRPSLTPARQLTLALANCDVLEHSIGSLSVARSNVQHLPFLLSVPGVCVSQVDASGGQNVTLERTAASKFDAGDRKLHKADEGLVGFGDGRTETIWRPEESDGQHIVQESVLAREPDTVRPNAGVNEDVAEVAEEFQSILHGLERYRVVF
ncbi:hypothetical protein C8Q76DRAFT_803949 [Earliella scabrosa]|nr:hypothetical protein C8Q76DRAFT_803949 [Earliella scabrosa]